MTHYVSQGPTEKEDYTLDWAAALGSDTITSSSWSAPPGITISDASNTATTATIWIAGGTLRCVYEATNTVVTAGGRTFVDSLTLTVVAK